MVNSFLRYLPLGTPKNTGQTITGKHRKTERWQEDSLARDPALEHSGKFSSFCLLYIYQLGLWRTLPPENANGSQQKHASLAKGPGKLGITE